MKKATIRVIDLQVSCIIGILPRERKEEQTILVSIIADYDISQAAASENIEHTLDYVEVVELLNQQLKSKQYELLERAVTDLSEQVLERWPSILRFSIEIKKPEALPLASYSSVQFETKRMVK